MIRQRCCHCGDCCTLRHKDLWLSGGGSGYVGSKLLGSNRDRDGWSVVRKRDWATNIARDNMWKSMVYMKGVQGVMRVPAGWTSQGQMASSSRGKVPVQMGRIKRFN